MNHGYYQASQSDIIVFNEWGKKETSLLAAVLSYVLCFLSVFVGIHNAFDVPSELRSDRITE